MRENQSIKVINLQENENIEFSFELNQVDLILKVLEKKQIR
jgi:hypothetical protein